MPVQTASESQIATQAPAGEPRTPSAAQAPKEDAAAIAAAKAAAENALLAFLDVKNRLEAKGASQWGAEPYAEVNELSRQADAFFMDRDYLSAMQKYQTAASQGKLLALQMPEIFQRLLTQGLSSLERGQSAQALENFKSALLINPEDPNARKYYQRAQVLDQVLGLVISANQHEADGNHALAYADFQKAVSLDPENSPAREGLARAAKQIKSNRFTVLMSEGLAALHRRDLKTARSRLMEAQTFQPGSPSVSDALQQLEQAEVLARIDALGRSAQAAEQSEDWDQALEAYTEVLKLDPSIRFAVQGKQRAGRHIYLLKRMDYYLNHPDSLEADELLQNALTLKADVDAINSPGPKMQEKARRFRQLLVAAQTPVKVIILSDNATEVTIYKVGRLGRFDQRHLRLRPGTYTVVGSKDGYQDVRKKLIIQSGQTAVRITVICEKEI